MDALTIALVVVFGNLNLFLLVTGIIILVAYFRIKKYLRARSALVRGFCISYNGDISAVNDQEKVSE